MASNFPPDALFNGVPLVVLQISIQLLQFKQSLFPGGFSPSRVQGRRNNPTFRDCVRNTLHFPGGKT